VFAVTEEPVRGWRALVIGSLRWGFWEPMAFYCARGASSGADAPLSLFSRAQLHGRKRATLTAYLGLGVDLFCCLCSAGGQGSARSGGLALLPVTSLMIVLSRRFGALADASGRGC